VHNFKKSLIAFSGLLAMITIIAAITPFRGYSQNTQEATAAAQDVRVVNTPALPVPTKIINAPHTPVPTKIVNAANAPVQTRDVDGPKAGNIVTLYANSETGYDFRRVFSNGTSAASEFVVPANQVLIVTDVVWEIVGANSGNGTTINLAVQGAGGAAHIVHVSHLTGDNSFGVTSTENLKTGFAAAAGAKIGMSIGGIGPSDVILHGYLIPAS
jgi:hypothetical protein